MTFLKTFILTFIFLIFLHDLFGTFTFDIFIFYIFLHDFFGTFDIFLYDI